MVFKYMLVAAALVALVHAQTTPVPILKQINKVNDDGSYTYGYEAADGTFKVETRDATGNVRGKYGYLDESGILKTVEYGAGKAGFEAAGEHLPEQPPAAVVSDNDFDDEPVAPVRRPAPARAQAPAPLPAPAPVQPAVPQVSAPQFNFQQQQQPQFSQPQVFNGVIGETPEVAAARRDHLAAHAAALALARANPEPEQQFVPQQRQQFAPQQQQPFVPQQQQQFVPQQQQQFVPQQQQFVPQQRQQFAPQQQFNQQQFVPQQQFNDIDNTGTRRGFSFSFEAPVHQSAPRTQQFQQPQFNQFQQPQFNQFQQPQFNQNFRGF